MELAQMAPRSRAPVPFGAEVHFVENPVRLQSARKVDYYYPKGVRKFEIGKFPLALTQHAKSQV